MPSRAAQIADALVAAWQAAFANGLISQAVTPARTWVPVTKQLLESLPPFDHANPIAAAIQVWVMPTTEAAAPDGDTRLNLEFDYPIQIGLAAKPLTLTNADIDPLSQVSQELRDFTLKLDPAYGLGIPEGVVEQPQILSDPYLDSLKTDRLFLTVFVLKFRGGRSR